MAVSVRHLVGREDELAALLDLLDAPDGLFAAAVVVGEAGIGKTTLSLAAAEAAEARGYLVLSCRPSEAEARFSFAGLADLIGGVVAEALPQLPRPQRRALEAALALSESDGASAEEGVVAFAFLNTLRRLAVGNRLLLVVDDVQWLDGPSLAMLRFALSRLEREPVAAIVTVRDEVPLWLRRGVAEERLLTIELGPLSVGALHELLRTRGGAVLARPTLLRIWETSGGNPFFALELAAALERRGGGGRLDAGAELPVPANLTELVRERLDRLGAPGIEVARVVALLADPTVGVVEAAAGRRAETGLSDALEAGILEVEGDRLRFAHPLLRSAAVSSSTLAHRRTLHARLATLVPDREERARHLALATPRPSGEVAAVVEEAAASVHARGASAAAAELGELAVRLTPPEEVEDLRRRVLGCADSHCEAGDGRRAIALLEQACKTAPPGAARAAVLVRLARTVDVVLGDREAIDLYREALAEAEGDDALVAEIHLSLGPAVAVTEDGNRGLEHTELAVQAASRTGDAALRCRALAEFGFLHFREGLGIPRERMEEALALERSLPQLQLTAPATWTSGLQLVWSGELERARRPLEEWREALRFEENPEEEGALWLLSLLEWRAGNWELAARHAAGLLELRAQFGREGNQPVSEWPAALIAAHQGQIEDARDRSERALALAEAQGVRVALSGHRWVLGFIELSRGEPAAALPYLEPAWEIREGVRLLEPGFQWELADTLEALIAGGEFEQAERRLIPVEERARRLDRSCAIAITARCRSLLLAARGDLAGAQAGFERALVEHARTQDPFQHARTLLAFGATKRRAKQRGAARVTLEQALAIFERVGAPLWAEQARAELQRIGGRAPSHGELTEAESRIAALVAEGRTNREVAAALFVTEHTVERALTRAYRKLGVRSRTELAHRLRHES
jgi:DNA-binding CsgD family transcriptional regulator